MPPLKILLPLALIALSSCTDEVKVNSGFEAAQAVVDAWLTTAPGPQTVYLTRTQDFYSGSNPTGITGAIVRVCRGVEGLNCVDFVEMAPGRYAFEATQEAPLANVGDELFLSIDLPTNAVGRGEPARTLVSKTQVQRTAEIDSLAFPFEEKQLGLDSGFYAELFAVDPVGPGDRYLIRTQVNDTLLNRIEELVLVYDASFDGGTTTDGIPFIFPIRFSVNKRDNDGAFVKLVAGDSVYTEVWSLSPEAFEFLQNAKTQIQNGDSQLFSLPVVNVRGNVRDAASGKATLGLFNVAAVSSIGRRFERP